MAEKDERFIRIRGDRFMGRSLRAFEELIEPHLPKEAAGDIHAFKGKIRQEVKSFSQVAVDLLSATDEQTNGAAVDLKDRLNVTQGVPTA